VHHYIDILRRLTRLEGYALDSDEFHHTTAQAPDTVCALISAACTITAADAQIAALTAAANVLWEVYAGPRTHDVMSMRERLDQVADELTRALAEQDRATARLRRECEALADLGTGLLARLPNHATQTGRPASDGPPPT
jgi:hypothetical protein